MKPHICLMKLTDFDELYALWQEVGLDVADKKTEFYEFTHSLKLNPASCFVAEATGKIIGSVLGLYNGRRAFIVHLAVASDWQGKGIGGAMLTVVEAALANCGVKSLRLYVAHENIAVVPFYIQHGYTVKDDALLMAKNL